MSKTMTARESIESLKRQQAETKLQEVSKAADVETSLPVIVETPKVGPTVPTYVVQNDVPIPDTGFANGRESKGVPALVKALAPPFTDQNGKTHHSSFAFSRNPKKAWRRDGSKRYAITEAAAKFGYEVEFRQMDQYTDRVFRMK